MHAFKKPERNKYQGGSAKQEIMIIVSVQKTFNNIVDKNLMVKKSKILVHRRGEWSVTSIQPLNLMVDKDKSFTVYKTNCETIDFRLCINT